MAKKPTDPGIIPLENFNAAGLADSKYSGTKNSLYKMTGVDPHSTPGILKVAQKLTKTSGIIVTEFCRERINCSNGIRYWFSATTGKVWQDKAGTFTLVYTLTAAAGAVICLGAAEYHGYLYIATQSRLHRIPIAASAADGAAAWSSNMVLNWHTFSITDDSFHPMFNHPAQQILYIGDGNYVAQVDQGTDAVGSETWTPDALDIATPLRIKSLGRFSADLLIGTYVANNIDQTQIIRWNGWNTDTFQSSDPIPEVGINSFLEGDNIVYVQAGLFGNLYIYDGDKLQLWKKIPGDYSSTATGEVHPSSIGNMAGQILFGFSGVTGDPTDEGIYRIAKNSSNYSYIMDFPYVISQRLSNAFILTGVDIGGILVSGTDLYVAWKRTAIVTITIASPGVVTFTGHGLSEGDAIVFSTTGGLPTGLTAGTVYFVHAVDANSLWIYDTSAHAISAGATGRVDTSSSQSGVHSAYHVGIDKLDYSNKLNGAYIESRVATIEREKLNNLFKAIVAYALMPASTSLSLYFDRNHAGIGSALATYDDVDRKIVQTTDEGMDFSTIRIRVLFNTNNNDAPQIEAGGIFTD